MASNTVRTIIFGLASIVVAEAYQNGAPVGVCQSMLPGHRVDAQTKDFPYSVTATKKGTQLLITLNTSSENDSFKGFLIQVRDSADNPIGSFSTPAQTKSLDCGTGKKNALTHSDSKEKKEIKTTWTAPSNFAGAVNVKVTVARDGATYWVAYNAATVNMGASNRRH